MIVINKKELLKLIENQDQTFILRFFFSQFQDDALTPSPSPRGRGEQRIRLPLSQWERGLGGEGLQSLLQLLFPICIYPQSDRTNIPTLKRCMLQLRNQSRIYQRTLPHTRLAIQHDQLITRLGNARNQLIKIMLASRSLNFSRHIGLRLTDRLLALQPTRTDKRTIAILLLDRILFLLSDIGFEILLLFGVKRSQFS